MMAFLEGVSFQERSGSPVRSASADVENTAGRAGTAAKADSIMRRVTLKNVSVDVIAGAFQDFCGQVGAGNRGFTKRTAGPLPRQRNKALLDSGLGRTRCDGRGETTITERFVRSNYFPPPLAPCEIIATALSTVSVPDTWLGGYSLNVRRNLPTMLTAGTIVQSFSPHHFP
jgi:hypothetical protein